MDSTDCETTCSLRDRSISIGNELQKGNDVRLYYNLVYYRGRQWETASLIFVFTLGCLWKCKRNKSKLAAILFLCRANLPRFDTRIWPHFHVKTCGRTLKSPLFNTQIGMSTALFNL